MPRTPITTFLKRGVPPIRFEFKCKKKFFCELISQLTLVSNDNMNLYKSRLIMSLQQSIDKEEYNKIYLYYIVDFAVLVVVVFLLKYK